MENTAVTEVENLNQKTKDELNTSKVTDQINFDDFLSKFGGFGRLQRFYFFAISMTDIFGAFGIMISVFAGATPKWRCNKFDAANSTSYSGDLNETLSLNETLMQCDLNGRKCIDIEFIDDFTSVVSEFTLVCERSYVIGTVRTLQMFGVWLGAVACSQLSDTIGRKKTFYITLLIEVLAGCLSSFSVNWQMYAVCRVLVGAGFGGVTSIACVYPIEFVGKKWRTLIGTISLWAVGVMTLALLGYFIREWRYLIMVTTFTTLPYFITYFFIPESPRWLLQKRRYAEAKKVLSKIALSNGKPLAEESELRTCSEEEKQEKNRVRVYSYLDLFKERKTIRTTFIMVSVWFDIVICYYVMTYNMEQLAGSRYLNMFLYGITEYPGQASTFILGNWLGRRITFSIYSAITIFCCLVVVIAHYTALFLNVPMLTTILTQIARACVSGGMSTLMFYTPELFPTVIRNLGLGAAYFSGRMAGMLAPQIVLLGMFYKLIPYFVVLVMTVLTTPLLFLLPETNGQPLEDTLSQPKDNKEQTKDEKGLLGDATRV